MPPYRQMFYQLCDLNVDEYVPRVAEPAGRPWAGGGPASLLAPQTPGAGSFPSAPPETPLSGSLGPHLGVLGRVPSASFHCPRVGS